MKIAIEEIKRRSVAAFKNAGISDEDAKIITSVILETEMRGVFTHGFTRLERYINCIKAGGFKTDGNYTVDFDSPSWALINGNDNLGIVISYKAMKFAMEKASNTGIGVVNVKGSHHFGAAGYYSSMCADANMAGFAMSNGDPTTDASEYMKGGTLMPFGEYKGYGLAMMVELFAETLSGAAMTKDVHAWNTDPEVGGNVGHMFVAMDISKLGNPSDYALRVEK